MLGPALVSVLGRGKSLMLSRSVSDRRMSRTARFPVIGKVICFEGGRGTYVATPVERQSRYVMLVRLRNKGNPHRHSSTRAPDPSIAARAHEITDLGSR
jgi:hypothetical protein